MEDYELEKVKKLISKKEKEILQDYTFDIGDMVELCKPGLTLRETESIAEVYEYLCDYCQIMTDSINDLKNVYKKLCQLKNSIGKKYKEEIENENNFEK